MRQALHIFKKDVRQFRYTIATVLALAVIFVFVQAKPWTAVLHDPIVANFARNGVHGIYALSRANAQWDVVKLLLPFAWCVLVAQVIHAESLPGDRQFWLTRPYDRKNLWVAKIMFVLGFVNLPIFVMQAAIVGIDGLSVLANLPGLLWEQVVLTTVVLLPAATLAAMTATLTQFILCGLLIATGFVAASSVILSSPSSPLSGRAVVLGQVAEPFDWLADSVFVTAASAVMLTVLFLQFMRRKTFLARTVGSVAGLLWLLALPVVPWNVAFAAQSRMGGPPQTAINVEIVRPPPLDPPSLPEVPNRYAFIDLPFRVTGLPSGAMLGCEGVQMTIETPSGVLWRSPLSREPNTIRQAADGCQKLVPMPATVFDLDIDQRVHIHATLYLTVFGDEQSTAIPLTASPVAVPGVGACAVPSRDQDYLLVWCRVAFRSEWPRLTWVGTRDASDLLDHRISYSPFPADLRLDPVDDYTVDRTSNAPGANITSITTERPISYLQTEVDLRDVRLGDFWWRGAH